MLSERLGGIVVTEAEREGINRRVAQLSIEAQRYGGKVSIAGYIRSLILADLATHQVSHGADVDAAELAAPVAGVSVPAPASEQAPGAAVEASDAGPPSAPADSSAPQKSVAATKAQPTADEVRTLLEACYAAGLSRNDLASLSGLRTAKLSHFRGANESRGQLTPKQLRSLSSVLRRWQKENA